jgi:hypothetical protein
MSKTYEEMSLAELTAAYNNKAETYGNAVDFPKLKSFKDKATAIARNQKIDAELTPAPAKKAKKATKAQEPKAEKPKAKGKKAKDATQAELEELLGAAPKKRRGRKASFEYEPLASITEPRDGTLRADCLAMLLEGTTIDELEAKMVEYRDTKGVEWKVSARYRALEILKLLNLQNGYGFTEEDGKIWAVVAG